MTNEEMAIKLTETEARSKSNTKRIDKLESDSETLKELATAYARMDERQGYMQNSIEETKENIKAMDGKIDKLASAADLDKTQDQVTAIQMKPAKKAEAIWEKILLVIVGALAAFVLSKIGL